MTTDKLNRMLAENPENIKSDVIKAALKLKQQQDAERNAAEALIRIERASEITGHAVTLLREVRKREKAHLAYVHAVGDAEEKFLSDGDFAKYSQAICDAKSQLALLKC